jgi:hypothetical protein
MVLILMSSLALSSSSLLDEVLVARVGERVVDGEGKSPKKDKTLNTDNNRLPL